MALEIFEHATYGDVFRSITIFVLTLIIVRILFPIIKKIVHQFTKRTETTLDNEIVESLEKPIYFSIILLGSYYAITGIDYLAPYNEITRKIFTSSGILLGTFTATILAKVVLNWYQKDIAQKTHTNIDDKVLPVLRKIINIAIFALGGILILNTFGMEITPLLASLGIGGLAVALALQPTLSNFFAGTYVLSEGAIRTGDFIELDNKIAGYVVEIGSRSTKIRTLPNNIVIIPNSKLAESIVTNYHAPVEELAVLVNVGVDYDSDLEKVEKVTIDVAREILQKTPGGVATFEPFIRFNEFGDSNIEFTVILRGKTFVDQYLIKHEFIKQLKKRYDEEGIEISYPVRKVYMK